MNKLKILASLNKIASSLDKTNFFKEADIVTNTMTKLAQNDEVPQTFEEIYKYKKLTDLKELVPTALDKLRQKAKQFTSLIINRVTKDPSFELKDYTKSEISVAFNELASFYKERGFSSIEGFKFPTKEENLLILQEAQRLQEILFQYIDNYNGQPINFDETTTIQSNILREELEKTVKKIIYVRHEHIEQIKSLLQNFGLPYIVSRGEAETLMAHLCKEDIIDGCISEDTDVLACGGKIFIRNF